MDKTIRFSRYNKFFLILSAAAILALGAVTVVRGGFNLSIDFRSGVVFTVTAAADLSPREIEDGINPLFAQPVQVQSVTGGVLGGRQRFAVKLASEQDDIAAFQKQAREKIAELKLVEIEASDLVSPAQSAYLRWQTWVLTLAVLVLILLYIWYRFQLRYAIAAVLALLHDTLILLGLIGAFRLDFSSTTIAAILTVIGYSLNDTIVVFDRIRENRTTMHTSNLEDIIDFSVTATLSRTLITSLTTLLAVLAIYFFAYGSVQLFALELIAGVAVGTYSSIYIASALVLLFDTQRRHALERGGTHSRGGTHGGALGKGDSRPLLRLRSGGQAASPLVLVKKGEPPPKQTAEEIRLATEVKRRKREARRKKKK